MTEHQQSLDRESPAQESRARESLARRQEELVRHLTAGGPPPPGFAADRLQVTAHTLLHKRRGEVARHLRLVEAQLGPEFSRHFLAWARDRPHQRSGIEAQEFLAHLQQIGAWETPAAARGIRRLWSRR